MTRKTTSPDPDLKAAWNTLRRGIADTLRPHVAAHQLDDLVTRLVADHIAGPGWKPPLQQPPDMIRDARIAHAMEAGQ